MPDGQTSHPGIDFSAPSGTAIISATHGEITGFAVHGCGGGTLTVMTDIVGYYEPRSKMRIPVYAKYVHVTIKDGLKAGDAIQPGDHIGFVQPWAADKCSGPIEHVHYELRVLDNKREHVDPSPHWLNGPGNVTCFNAGVSVPKGKAVAPLRCKPSRKLDKAS
ncbi:MAG: M23 family metallopeptidase [Proteobacteria bacterium]|nr:M23 family metallopeptidase [Pseudomonadota bacterium]